MKTVKAILEILVFGISIFKGYKKAKNEKKDQEYLKAIRAGDIDYINRYLKLGKL